MALFWPPQDQNFWYLKRGSINPCRSNMSTDVAIIGGGMAGLSAAQAFHQRGKKVALFEQYYCGSGASGKSSGFITPNAELSLTDFSKRYSLDVAHQIWQCISSGVEAIRRNCLENNFACEYAPQNTLVVASNQRGLKMLTTEYENLKRLGYKANLFDQQTVRAMIGSKNYYGGVEYEDTFGLDSYLYCQALKDHLQQQGVQIFEETPVTALEGRQLKTIHATIDAEIIIACTDHMLPQLGLLKQEVFHAQTFLMVSQVLTPAEIKALFPKDQLMVWDTEFIYNYFRVTAGNRLLLGGGNMQSTYAQPKHDYRAIQRKLTTYFARQFPASTIQFEQFWQGLIGISKDIGPIAGRDKEKPYLYYVTAAAGLPIAAALGRYAAEHMIDGRTDLDAYFSPYRSFPIGGLAQKILGNTISFGLSNLLKLNVP